MKSPRFRTQVVVLAFLLLPAAVGVLAVHASATCERFVRTYVTKPVRNTVSKQTAEAWAKWRIAHPNWKPNPASHRPKYVMTREEAVQKVDFACSVPTDPTSLSLLVKPAELPPPIVGLPQMPSTQITFPELTQPEIAEMTPVVPVLPVIPPAFPLSTGAVPEPVSLLLVGTGFGLLCLLLARRAAANPPVSSAAKLS